MANILVIGAGVGGLSTAMVLALDGHDVTVLERDPAPPPAGADEAWDTWERRGVTQFRLPHFLLARWRDIAEREIPDAVEALEKLGALRFSPVDSLPAAITGGRQAGDDRYEAVTARRPVIEAAVASTAAATLGVTVRRGVAVAGLIAEGTRLAGVPHVVGVRTEDGDEVRADLVVDSTGRRSALPRWLDGIGARPPDEQREDSGFVYYARHYRGDEPPETLGGLLQDYESVSLLTLPADNGTWSVAFIASARDAELRALRDPDRFDAALDLYPCAARWRAGTPLTGVDTIAKIGDRVRHFSVDDRPVVSGLVAVADAWACTNPSLGRGISIGLVHACALRDLLREVPPSEAETFVRRWHAVTEETVTPLYDATVAYDRHRLAEIDAEIAGEAYEPDDPSWAMAKALQVAAPGDPALFRVYMRIVNVLATPEECFAEPGVFEQVIAGAADKPRYALPGAHRSELVATVTR